MKFEQVCQSALAFFQQSRIFKVLLPISIPIMFIVLALDILGIFVSLGSFVNALIFFVFFLSLFLTLARCNFRMAAIGLGVYALEYLISMLTTIIKYKYMPYGTIVYLVVYGILAFAAYKKSVSFN